MINKTLIAGALLLAGGTAAAATWQVEITNVTPGQIFTPLLVATHSGNIDLFEVGEAASANIERIAEGGDIGPAKMALESAPYGVGDIQTHDALLMPGESVTLTLRGRPGQRLSLASMLIHTNDTFVGVDSVFLPVRGGMTIEALAYDAGTEFNDQDCANIPGPDCGGAPFSPAADTDEKFIHVGNGFHTLGEGTLAPAAYDWNNPVAIINVQRVYGHGW